MGWFVLGLIVGLAVGAAAVVALVRATARARGTTPRAVAGLVVDGLRPGSAPNGVAAQRALARRLKRTGEQSASGTRVAPAEVTLHVSPEGYEAIERDFGIAAAESDLAEFTLSHARRAGWHVSADPRVVLSRDISLKPRQSFAQAVLRASEAAPVRAQAPEAAPERPPVAPRPVRQDEAVTDVLPAGLVEPVTRSYPAGFADDTAPGDLLVVHGTDVRTIRAARGTATVGRGAHNDIVIDAPGIARDHVVLERRAGSWWVVPGTAATVTALDGRVLQAPAALEGQGLLELGRGVRLRLSVEAAAA